MGTDVEHTVDVDDDKQAAIEPVHPRGDPGEPVDRMLLKSKDRPKVDGLPVAEIELSAGMCKQVGNFATRLVSSISCSATDKNGQKYDLQYESDGSPIEVRRVRQTKAGRPAVSPFD